ncbi:MAG: deoxyribonuclease IV [Cenarchaeum sp. SB0678_bin_8]|nr:deoxyribonuclease IV [Cenarchaeum sp. SB0664_bin_35]MXZ94026.1 deoxyribonuclease IV [Cenarchaeum sp. SB0666_bin_15]MYB47539.1 deoxyribonuclease IV [Cenarchaeum sp. SB0662_bin_33]MYD59208.1 deoxyribonuclease IV [Cenarchaeum sp. SB0678_bin_8]MYJ27803.1 deoxyribonuclease IV [Cenarchaeum sp. SB0672_bin_9]
MKIGCHVSISGSIDMAVDRAVERGCTAFQIFSRNPRGWRAKAISESESTLFHKKVASSGIDKDAVCVHMPYLPNLAGSNDEPYKKSVNTLKDEVERCNQLGIQYLVTHLGSHLGAGTEAGIRRLIEAYTVAAEVDKNVIILLENMAGQKNSIGYKFEELARILNQLEPNGRFGVCLDTCHAFVAGYDLRTREAASQTLEEFDGIVGYDRLKVLHLNDARGGLGSNLDRHYHIGLGNIGTEGLKEVVNIVDQHNIPIILETPIDDTRTDIENIQAVKQFA